MNPYKDIDDGLDEFEDARAREQAETYFKTKPSYFSQADERFYGSSVDELHITGPRTSGMDSPFAFESGYARITGKDVLCVLGNPLTWVPATMTVRWGVGGEARDIVLQPGDQA